MRIHILLMLISSTFLSVETNKTSLLSRLPDVLQKLCPGVRVCPENQTNDLPLKAIEPGFESCCTECSCSSDCEANGNCCFPPKIPTEKHANAECLIPASVQPNKKQKIKHLSYYMISTSPDSSFDTSSTANGSCGDVNVASWGSLYPVFSPTQKQIYKNNICATAHGVQDGQLWNAQIICETSIASTDVTKFVLGLDSNFVHDSCKVEFFFKGEFEDIRPLICYTDLVDTCDGTDFQIPDVINASREELTEACISGIVSPYRQHSVYANAFCLICNGVRFKQNNVCLARQNSMSRSGSWQGFIGLIDNTFLAETYHKAPLTVKHLRACPTHDKETSQSKGCRLVFCPSGQLRDRRGKCRYPTSLWYNQLYTIPISLIAEEKVDIYEAFNIKPLDLSRELPNLISPWQQNWKIAMIQYDISGQSESSTTLLVRLSTTLSEVNPVKLINTIKNVVKRNWYLRHNNITYTFKSDFVKFKDKFPLEGSKSSEYTGNLSDSFTRVYLGINMLYKPHYITKLYICDQVELTESDFVVVKDQEVIYNKLTAHMMYTYEFAFITTPTDNGSIVRVCVEDSGLYLTDQNDISNGQNLEKSYFLQLLVAFLVRQCVFFIIK